MVLVNMGGEDGVDLGDAEGIVNDGGGAQVRLRHPATGHVAHLMGLAHLLDLLGALVISKPRIDNDIGVAFRLDPDAGIAQPPQINGSGATSVSSTSSFSHVPHSGKAPRIQFSRVMSSTLLIMLFLSCFFLLSGG